MKRIITILICIGMISVTYLKFDTITNYIIEYFNSTPEVRNLDKNNYAKSTSYDYIKITDSVVPYNFGELINIFYTVLDAGESIYTFYCPVEYEDCLSDVERISSSDNTEVLTTIGNYISPFNNFNTIRVQYDTAGEVTIEVEHIYSEEDIISINKKIDEIWSTLVNDTMDKKDIIYAFHDYIINNTRYDEEYENQIKQNITPTRRASTAIGPLFEGHAICSGYTDTMAIVLDRLGIKNYKVASNTHVWNALYLDGKWLHLDLTWDDPVSQDHSVDNLLHKFYLIDTETLESFDIADHTFNKSIYTELK